MRRSDAQLEALKPYDGNMLISAGAGSGKTQVLSQKVHDILKSGKAKPESILVVTFTVAAAFEMKQRIKQNLAKNGVSKDIINKIDSSHIQTFDSFANYLVRKYASYIGVSENIGILDDNILSVKIHEYIEEILDEQYKISDPKFINLLKSTCIKNDQNLRKIVMNLYKKISTYENKFDVLNNYETKYFDIEKIKQDYYGYLSIYKKYFIDLFETIFNKNFIDDTDRLGKLIPIVNDIIEAPIEQFYDAIQAFKNPRAKARLPEEVKAPFNKFNDMVKELKGKLKEYPDIDAAVSRVVESKEDVLYLIKIVKKLDEKIEAYKKYTNSYTFNDIARMSLKLFEIPELKQKIRDSFKFILVDEYQDTSDIQERFIEQISNNNVYMVGDIKQSIYKFRFANCDIFRNKYFLYKKDTSKGKKVDMIDNFRSRPQILSTVNDIFSSLMTAEMGGADYKADHIINYGLKDYDDKIFDENLYGMKLLTYNSKDENIDRFAEIKVIANKIIDLINNETQVYDKDGFLRPIQFSDIAILVRRKTNFNNFVRIFSDFNIPISCDTKNSYSDYDSLLAIESILTGINYFRNNLNDEAILKYVFASVGRSYLFDYSDEYIYNKIKDGTYIRDELFEKCSSSAAFSVNNSVEDTFNFMIYTFGIIKNLYKLEYVPENLDKIEFLNGMARNFDISKLSFDDFCDFFFKLKEYDVSLEIETLDQTKNAVQLMTNHKSKGLEWPIVFLSDITKSLSTKPNEIEEKGKFNLQSGIYYKRYGSQQLKCFYDSYMKMLDKYEESSEYIRIFYVALTRARETLYMVCDSVALNKPTVPIIKDRNILNLYKLSQVELKEEEGSYKDNILEGHNLVVEFDDKNSQIVEFCRVFEEKTSRTASHAVDKNELNDDLQSKLDFGIKLHEYMEIVDFKNPDISYIDEPRAKKIISKVLQMDVFKNCLKEDFIDAYKEYEFIDDNLHGFVDLFLLFEDRIELIDYKLKNIDKDEYKIQLKTYKDYLEKTFQKPCRTYLISLLDTRMEEIIHE